MKDNIRKRGMGIENLRIFGKTDTYKLIYDFPEKNEPDEAQIFRLNKGFSEKFMPVEISRNVFNSKLTVSLSGYCSLTQYLPMLPLKRNHFLHIISDIITAMEDAEALSFSRKHILMDPSYVMISPSELNVKFILIPDRNFVQNYPLNVLLRNIAERAVFSSDTDISFLDEYVDITYMDEKICAARMKNFISKMINGFCDDSGETLKRCPGCGALGIVKDICAVCGYNTAAKIPAQKPDSPELVLQEEKVENAFLEHCDDGEIIPVDKFPFRMGRLTDNTEYTTFSAVVSRKHAELTHENSQYYISDKNSTNGTFINNKKIKSSEKVALNDSDVFTLGDESFIFFVK